MSERGDEGAHVFDVGILHLLVTSLLGGFVLVAELVDVHCVSNHILDGHLAVLCRLRVRGEAYSPGRSTSRIKKGASNFRFVGD